MLVYADGGSHRPVLRRDGNWTVLQSEDAARNSEGQTTMDSSGPNRSKNGPESPADHTIQLKLDDMLFLYTDGAVEYRNAQDERFGEDRLLGALGGAPADASPESVISCVSSGIASFAKGAEQTDDITMLCLKYNGIQAGDSGVLVGDGGVQAEDGVMLIED